MRVSRKAAKQVKAGDQVVLGVVRTFGMQGRKPQSGSPLMRIELEDGTVIPIRENTRVNILNAT